MPDRLRDECKDEVVHGRGCALDVAFVHIDRIVVVGAFVLSDREVGQGVRDRDDAFARSMCWVNQGRTRNRTAETGP
jgi:hypothetical protein